MSERTTKLIRWTETTPYEARVNCPVDMDEEEILQNIWDKYNNDLSLLINDNIQITGHEVLSCEQTDNGIPDLVIADEEDG